MKIGKVSLGMIRWCDGKYCVLLLFKIQNDECKESIQLCY